MENNEQNSDEIECPFCAEKIKAKAKKCKHCGEMIDSQVLDSTTKDTLYTAEKLKSDNAPFICWSKRYSALLVVIIIGVLVYAMMGERGAAILNKMNIPDAQGTGANEQKVVADCADHAMKINGSGFPQDFSAYITPDGRINYIGTAGGRFSFEKCLNEHGVTLDH